MQPNDDSASESFLRMLQVLSEDKELRAWFFSLKPMTGILRQTVLGRMIEEMRANDEDPELITAVQSLMDPLVYDAALTAMAKYGE